MIAVEEEIREFSETVKSFGSPSGIGPEKSTDESWRLTPL